MTDLTESYTYWLTLVYFAIAFTIGYWNHSRGNSFWVGFVLSLFCFPAGLLLVGLTKRNEKKLAERAIKSGTLKRCPKCAEMVQAFASKCRYCGSDI